jgi:hypothetical protein
MHEYICIPSDSCSTNPAEIDNILGLKKKTVRQPQSKYFRIYHGSDPWYLKMGFLHCADTYILLIGERVCTHQSKLVGDLDQKRYIY